MGNILDFWKENEVVTVHGWITDATFTDIVAISQMTPGPFGIIGLGAVIGLLIY